MPIDTQTFMSLFRANNVSDKCPSCGKESWRLGNDKVSLPYEGDGTKGITAVPLICSNCDHVRLFLDNED